MGKLQIFDILLDQNPAVYYPGNVVSGHVVVELSDVMKMRGEYGTCCYGDEGRVWCMLLWR